MFIIVVRSGNGGNIYFYLYFFHYFVFQWGKTLMTFRTWWLCFSLKQNLMFSGSCDPPGQFLWSPETSSSRGRKTSASQHHFPPNQLGLFILIFICNLSTSQSMSLWHVRFKIALRCWFSFYPSRNRRSRGALTRWKRRVWRGRKKMWTWCRSSRLNWDKSSSAGKKNVWQERNSR